MELFQALKERRSIRFYEDKAVELSKLNKIVEAATWAPTAGNAQTWFFIIMKEEQKLEDIKSFSPGILGSPKSIIVACTDFSKIKKTRTFNEDEGKILAIIDLAMACENMMLAALEFGLGTCAIRSFNKVAVVEMLSLPENIKPQLLITVGYPKSQPQKPTKLLLKQVVNYEEYGRKNCESIY